MVPEINLFKEKFQLDGMFIQPSKVNQVDLVIINIKRGLNTLP